MPITRDTVVTLEYRVTDTGGQVVDPGQTPIVYLHGDYEGIFPKIEAALAGKEVGDSILIRLEPDDAFGDYDAELVELEDAAHFPADLQVGAMFERIAPGGGEDDELALYRVTDIADGKVVLDGNHPLAGLALNFSGTVAAVRPATAVELTLRCPAP